MMLSSARSAPHARDSDRSAGATADAERLLIDRAEAELARRQEPKLVDAYSDSSRADLDAAIAAESKYLARFRGCIGADVRAKHERQLERLQLRREQMNLTERACDGAKPTLVDGLPHGAYGAAVTADDLVSALGRRVPLDARQEAQVRTAFEAWRQRACFETGTDPTHLVERSKYKELQVDTAARQAAVARKYLEVIDAIRGSALAAAAFLDSTARGESLDAALGRVRATSILGDVALTLPAAPVRAHSSSVAPPARGADSTQTAAATRQVDGSAPPAPKRPPTSTAVGQVATIGPPLPKARAPVEKFSEYVFKEGATHGKDAVFRRLGYGKEHSADLARMWEQQAAAKHARGEYTLGKADQYGQRINIEIEVRGIGDAAGKTSYMQSGWMVLPDGSIKLNTPFSGFTR